jgi:hypothetical protein
MTLDELEALARAALDDAPTYKAHEAHQNFVSACSPETVMGLIGRVRELEAEVQRLREALEHILHIGTDCPAAMDEASFYRSQLHKAVGRAVLAASRAPTPSAPPAPEPNDA